MKLRRYVIISSLIALLLLIIGVSGLYFNNPDTFWDLGKEFNLLKSFDYELVEKKFDVTKSFDLEIDLELGDVVLAEKDVEQIEIEAYDSTYFKYEIEFIDNELRIVQVKSFIPRFNRSMQAKKLVINIPKNSLKDATINTNLGEIEITNLSFQDLELTTDLGAIDLSILSGDDIYAYTKLGEVQLEGLELSGDLDAQSNLGDFTINQVEAKRLEAHSDLGDIEASNVFVEKLILTTALGDVKATNPKNGYIIEEAFLSTDLGNAKANLEAERLEIDD